MISAAFRPVHELAVEIAARRLSPVDLVDEYLARIERLEPRLHAFVSVNAGNARLAAEAAEKAIRAGHSVGPLHGIPIAIKDLVEIEGQVAMGGSAAWRNRIAPHTATLMRRLTAAGMVNLGKTHTVESPTAAGAPTSTWARPGIRGTPALTARLAVHPQARVSRLLPAWCPGQSARTRADRCASRRRGTASPD